MKIGSPGAGVASEVAVFWTVIQVAPAAMAESQFKLLVFAKANTYHYEYIPIARDSLEQMARLHSFELVWTRHPESFDEDLSQYAAVMFLNSPGEELNAGQRAKFEAYMRGGGNAMIVHRAAITPPSHSVTVNSAAG